MQKKIIALAIASALAAPGLALAAVNVYGTANLSVDIVNDGAVSNGATDDQLNSNTSTLGLKGSEDIGNGLSAVYQAEGSVVMDTAGSVSFAFNRDTFLGLSSASWGTLLAGQHDTPYKMATRNLDLFADGIADNRGNQSTSTTFNNTILMGGGHDITLGNVLAYVSPAMSGFTIAAAAVLGAESANGGANQNKGSAYSLAGLYSQGPWYGALAYQDVKVGDNNTGDLGANSLNTPPGLAGVTVWANGDTTKAMKLGGSYTVEQFGVNAVVEKITSHVAAASANDITNTNYYLGGKFNFTSADDVKLAYTKRGSQSGTTNDANEVTVGYDHTLSKSTSVYALYTKLTDNTAGSSDPSALSLGIKHAF